MVQAMKYTLHSPEARFQDPRYTARLGKQDLATISQKMSHTLGHKLSDLLSGKTPLSQISKPTPVPRGTGKRLSPMHAYQYTIVDAEVFDLSLHDNSIAFLVGGNRVAQRSMAFLSLILEGSTSIACCQSLLKHHAGLLATEMRDAASSTKAPVSLSLTEESTQASHDLPASAATLTGKDSILQPISMAEGSLAETSMSSSRVDTVDPKSLAVGSQPVSIAQQEDLGEPDLLLHPAFSVLSSSGLILCSNLSFLIERHATSENPLCRHPWASFYKARGSGFGRISSSA